jgi:methionyl-tRNA synthetase
MENFILNNFPLFLFLLFTLMVWSIIWKGLALWKSARLGHKPWFIAMIIVNTAGLLEILYLFVFSKMVKKNK